MSNAKHSSTVSRSVQRLRPIGDFASRVPKTFELFNMPLVQEKTCGKRQCGCLAQKVPGWVVASSMQKDASDAALDRNTNLPRKGSFQGLDTR